MCFVLKQARSQCIEMVLCAVDQLSCTGDRRCWRSDVVRTRVQYLLGRLDISLVFVRRAGCWAASGGSIGRQSTMGPPSVSFSPLYYTITCCLCSMHVYDHIKGSPPPSLRLLNFYFFTVLFLIFFYTTMLVCH